MATNNLMTFLRLAGQPDDRSKLIRTLRWIGLEEEARQLQRSFVSVPPEQRAAVAGRKIQH